MSLYERTVNLATDPLVAWISKDNLADLIFWSINSEPLETGGCFAGYYANGSKEIVITDLIDSGPNASRSSNRFTPDREYQDRKLEALWTQSDGTKRYLGDWHSHPKGQSTLSNLDGKRLREIAWYPEAYLDRPVMGVYGGSQRRVDLYMYEGSSSGLICKENYVSRVTLKLFLE